MNFKCRQCEREIEVSPSKTMKDVRCANCGTEAGVFIDDSINRPALAIKSRKDTISAITIAAPRSFLRF